WRENYLRTMVVFSLSNGYDFAYSGLAIRDENGRYKKLRGEEFNWNKCVQDNFVDLNVYFHRWDKERFRVYFDERLRRAVDWDFLLSQVRGSRVGYAPFVGCDYLDSQSDLDRISIKQPFLFLK